jgi:hypothetical protein
VAARIKKMTMAMHVKPRIKAMIKAHLPVIKTKIKHLITFFNLSKTELRLSSNSLL